MGCMSSFNWCDSEYVTVLAIEPVSRRAWHDLPSRRCCAINFGRGHLHNLPVWIFKMVNSRLMPVYITMCFAIQKSHPLPWNSLWAFRAASLMPCLTTCIAQPSKLMGSVCCRSYCMRHKRRHRSGHWRTSNIILCHTGMRILDINRHGF